MTMLKKALMGLGATCVLLTIFSGAPRAAAGDVVLYGSDATNLHGNWSLTADTTAAGGRAITSNDNGWSTPDSVLAAPADYFDVTFAANAATKYHVWFRLRAASDSKLNDSVFAQFSDAVTQKGAA